MEKTLIDLVPQLEALGASQRNAADWIDRIDWLRHFLPPTLPGQPRMFNSMHAKALMFVAAFVKGGARPKNAAAYAASLIDAVQAGEQLAAWVVVSAGDFNHAEPADEIDIHALTRAFGMVPITLLPVRAIAAMVDKLYEAV